MSNSLINLILRYVFLNYFMIKILKILDLFLKFTQLTISLRTSQFQNCKTFYSDFKRIMSFVSLYGLIKISLEKSHSTWANLRLTYINLNTKKEETLYIYIYMK